MLKEAKEILSRSRSKEALDTGDPGRQRSKRRTKSKQILSNQELGIIQKKRMRQNRNSIFKSGTDSTDFGRPLCILFVPLCLFQKPTAGLNRVHSEFGIQRLPWFWHTEKNMVANNKNQAVSVGLLQRNAVKHRNLCGKPENSCHLLSIQCVPLNSEITVSRDIICCLLSSFQIQESTCQLF